MKSNKYLTYYTIFEIGAANGATFSASMTEAQLAKYPTGFVTCTPVLAQKQACHNITAAYQRSYLSRGAAFHPKDAGMAAATASSRR